MNLSIIIPTTHNIITYKNINSVTNDLTPECPECLECPEWGSVIYDFMNKNDILKENIEKGYQLEIDMKLVIEGRLFSQNFEKYFEKIRDSIVLGLKIVSSRDEERKEEYKDEYKILIMKHTQMLYRLKKLCQDYFESKKIWWN